MVVVTLYCGIIGVAGSVFSIDIDTNKSVDHLKDVIAAKQKYNFAASELQLFLAMKDDAWLTEEEVKSGVRDTSGLKLLDAAREEIGDVGLSEDAVRVRVSEAEIADLKGPVHVLVKVPEQAANAASIRPGVPLPSTIALDGSDKYAEECISLDEWGVGVVHKIPLIWNFMSRLGGCTKKGEIFWRMEDKQVVSTLVDGWFRESSPDHINVRANKKSILMGSLGIGKSTLLCVLAFHLVFKHTKNVLVYRRLAKSEQESCLLYLGYEGDKVVYFSLSLCDESEAKFFYRVLRGQHGVSNVWLLLDGYRYQDIPEGVRTFKMLATSQQVDLTSRERIHAYCCLMPCWSKKDLWLMGDLIYKFATEDMEERFYYSGGSVHEFTLPTPEDIRSVIDAAISGVDDVSNLLSNMTERAQSDRLRHTFVKNSDDTSQFTVRRYWEQVIDSEYAVLGLSVRLTSDALFRIYTWAKSAGHGSLVESVFEIYLHRLAADNTLSLYISEYDPPKRRQPNEERHLKMKPVVLRNGGAICCGTASNHENDLKKWRDDDTFTYWFPACHDFPNINSIVKLESASSKKSNVAYLHFTAAADREIDGEQLRKMNTIFFPDDVEGADDTEPPIYIAVCPDLKSCETFVLKPPPQVLAARKTCRVYVGYYWAATLDLPPPPMFR